MNEVTLSAITGFEFKSEETNFQIHCVSKDHYEMVLNGAYIHFSPKQATLSVNEGYNENDRRSATFKLTARDLDGALSLELCFPLKAAKKLSKAFPEFKLITGIAPCSIS